MDNYYEEKIEPMPDSLKKKMRKEVCLQLRCIYSLLHHIEFNRDMWHFREMMMNTACAMRDAVATFDEEVKACRKEQS